MARSYSLQLTAAMLLCSAILGGAAAGEIIGATVDDPGVGAAIGALGLTAGALIGDYIQGQEQRQYHANQQQIQRSREAEY